MDTITPDERRRKFNEDSRRKRRDIARDVWAAYRVIVEKAGCSPIEARTAEAVSLCHYEYEGQDYDTPRNIGMLLIGTKLSSSGKSDEGKINTASNRTSHFFTNAQPRTGYQLLTRYKAVEDKRSHEYVDHIMPVAEVVAELWAVERAAIRKDKQPQKQARIAAALERLAIESLVLLPKCDAQLVDENGEVYAYLSDAEARTHSTKNPNFKAQPKTARPKRRFNPQDDDRLTQKIRNLVADILDEYRERNGLPDANKYSVQAQQAVYKEFESWRKTAPAREREEGETEEINHVPEIVSIGTSEPGEILTKVVNTFPVSTNVCNTENFDSALDAAIWYARDEWPVLPVCNARAEGCSWPKHGPECRGRKPLVKGDGTPGYSGATTDLDTIGKWYAGEFRNQGVALRMDGKVAIDADVKDGGPQSYRELADTFNLDATLEQATHTGGEHHIFYLPEGMPDGHLKSWVRVGDKVGLPGLDLKVGRNGLLFVEPTQGPKGFYRWVNVDAPLATLPRECADFLHDAQKAKAAKASARVYTSSDVRQFDSDQSKFFVDVSNGDRHDRLLTVGNAMWHAGASESEMLDGMRYHASRFSDPLNDDPWIVRTVGKIAREVLR